MTTRNRSLTLNCVYAFFGLVLGTLAALASAIMLFSLDVLNSEMAPISLSMRLKHYVSSSMPLIGYGAMVIAYFHSNVHIRWRRNLLIVGLIVGVIAAIDGLRIYGSTTWGYLFLGHTSYGLETSIFFCSVLTALIFVGIALIKEVQIHGGASN